MASLTYFGIVIGHRFVVTTFGIIRMVLKPFVKSSVSLVASRTDIQALNTAKMQSKLGVVGPKITLSHAQVLTLKVGCAKKDILLKSQFHVMDLIQA